MYYILNDEYIANKSSKKTLSIFKQDKTAYIVRIGIEIMHALTVALLQLDLISRAISVHNKTYSSPTI